MVPRTVVPIHITKAVDNLNLSSSSSSSNSNNNSSHNHRLNHLTLTRRTRTRTPMELMECRGTTNSILAVVAAAGAVLRSVELGGGCDE